MAHCEKFQQGATGHMFGHYDRSKETGDNVDSSLTHLNYNLADGDQPLRQMEFLQQRLSEVKVQKRKDVNLFCDWIITAPKNLPKEDEQQFFQEAYNFCSERYGKENVISAYVHYDEPNAAPHIHFAFVPVVDGVKKTKGVLTPIKKVNANDLISRQELRMFHPQLQNHLEKCLGHEVAIMNGATKDGNKAIIELKRQSAVERLQQAEREANNTRWRAEQKASKMIAEADLRVKELEQRKMSLEITLEAQAKFTEVSAVNLFSKYGAKIIPAKDSFITGSKPERIEFTRQNFNAMVKEFNDNRFASAANIAAFNEQVKALEQKDNTIFEKYRELRKSYDNANEHFQEIVAFQVRKVVKAKYSELQNKAESYERSCRELQSENSSLKEELQRKEETYRREEARRAEEAERRLREETERAAAEAFERGEKKARENAKKEKLAKEDAIRIELYEKKVLNFGQVKLLREHNVVVPRNASNEYCMNKLRYAQNIKAIREYDMSVSPRYDFQFYMASAKACLLAGKQIDDRMIAEKMLQHGYSLSETRDTIIHHSPVSNVDDAYRHIESLERQYSDRERSR